MENEIWNVRIFYRAGPPKAVASSQSSDL